MKDRPLYQQKENVLVWSVTVWGHRPIFFCTLRTLRDHAQRFFVASVTTFKTCHTTNESSFTKAVSRTFPDLTDSCDCWLWGYPKSEVFDSSIELLK